MARRNLVVCSVTSAEIQRVEGFGEGRPEEMIARVCGREAQKSISGRVCTTLSCFVVLQVRETMDWHRDKFGKSAL